MLSFFGVSVMMLCCHDYRCSLIYYFQIELSLYVEGSVCDEELDYLTLCRTRTFGICKCFNLSLLHT